MFELPMPLVLGIAGVLAVALYLFFWRAVSELSVPMKVAARLLLTVVLILPIALVIFGSSFGLFHSMNERTASVDSGASQEEPATNPGDAAPDSASPPAMKDDTKPEQPRSDNATPTKIERPKSKAKPPEFKRERSVAKRKAPASPKKMSPGVASPSPPSASDDFAGAGGSGANRGENDGRGLDDSLGRLEEETSEEVVTGAGAPIANEPEADWTIVPVYFGTDRKQKEGASRIEYDWQRARRMELGRALVTIPKAHVVPMVERPWAVRIPYLDITLYEAAEDPQKHFTISEVSALSREDFLSQVRAKISEATRFKDHALVFIHGYKNHFDNAVFRTAQIAYDLQFDSAPFLYSWPSGGTLQGYTYDRDSAAQAEPYLKEFLDLVVDDTGAKKISIIAHSMGNQLLLRVLQDLKRSRSDEVVISQLILAAPDVDRDTFENIVQSINGVAEGITLYTAANDAALKISRRVNGGVARAGDVPETGPIVVDGVDTIDATATSMDSIGINHSGYAENNALLTDIGLLIATGQRPPESRVPTLERVTTDKGDYWRYPNPAP